MPYGDKKRYKGRGSSSDWGTWGRGRSKSAYDRVTAADDIKAYLDNLDDAKLLEVVDRTGYISRYGKYDWKRILGSLSEEDRECIECRVERLEVERKERDKEKREESIRKANEHKDSIVDEARLASGWLQTEIASSIRYKESVGLQQGDWLDDPVAAATGHGGFAEETRESAGINLQVNVCLDSSNSMYYNNLDKIGVQVVRQTYLTLHKAAAQFPPHTLTVNLWTWAGGEDGKSVRQLDKVHQWSDSQWERHPKLGPTALLPKYSNSWTGEDTWLYPLLEKLEKWELENGDRGDYRLDLILSDGVLEHPTDPRQCNDVQMRRDGNLQTIILNFLPFEEWGDYSVPSCRCVQYPVTVDNLGAMMRQIFGDWIVCVG